VKTKDVRAGTMYAWRSGTADWAANTGEPVIVLDTQLWTQVPRVGLRRAGPHNRPGSGGYLAHYWARMDHAHRARPDCRVVIKKAPSTYLKKFYFDTITFDTQMLRHLIDKYGPEHVVLGTDYPFDMGMDDPVKFIETVPRLTRADKDKIMGGNAARLLKIKR